MLMNGLPRALAMQMATRSSRPAPTVSLLRETTTRSRYAVQLFSALDFMDRPRSDLGCRLNMTPASCRISLVTVAPGLKIQRKNRMMEREPCLDMP